MKYEAIRDLIKERIRISETTNDEWDDGIEAVWKKVKNIFFQDPDGMFDFFEHHCTDEELLWLSEMFDELIPAFNGDKQKLMAVLRQRAQKVSDPGWRKDILYEVDWAEGML